MTSLISTTTKTSRRVSCPFTSKTPLKWPPYFLDFPPGLQATFGRAHAICRPEQACAVPALQWPSSFQRHAGTAQACSGLHQIHQHQLVNVEGKIALRLANRSLTNLYSVAEDNMTHSKSAHIICPMCHCHFDIEESRVNSVGGCRNCGLAIRLLPPSRIPDDCFDPNQFDFRKQKSGLSVVAVTRVAPWVGFIVYLVSIAAAYSLGMSLGVHALLCLGFFAIAYGLLLHRAKCPNCKRNFFFNKTAGIWRPYTKDCVHCGVINGEPTDTQPRANRSDARMTM